MEEKVVKVPKFKCSSCENCNHSIHRCNVLNRPIAEDYNRCFKHSNYITNSIK